MGLKIWLPLNGNLENQGVSTVTATNNGAIVNTAGKIGSCYSFDGTDDFLTLNNFNPNGWPEISISAWVYPTADFVALFLIRGGGQHRVRISTNGFMFRDTNNSGTLREIAFSPTIPVNVWTHITCIYKRGEIWIYQNGIQTAHSATYYNATSTLLSDMGEFRIGRQQSSSGNIYYTGKVNDFRIYDHALSAAEVREISQGLVLHYKLDGGMNGNENLILASHKITTSGSSSGITRTYMDDDSLKVVAASGNGNWCSIGFAKNSNDNVGAKLAAGDTYTISCDVKVENGTTLPTIFINSGNSYKRLQGTIIQNSWIRAYYTSTWANPGTGYGNISLHLGFSGLVGTYYFKNFKLEKSSFPTVWSPAPADGGVDLTQIQDSSGYNNNGVTYNSPAISSNTPRYSGSTFFDSSKSQCIKGSTGALVTDAITVSLWMYMSDWSTMTATMRPITAANSCGWYIDPYNDGYITIWVLVGPSSNNSNKLALRSNIKYKQLSSGWHHMAFTYDQASTKFYIEGELNSSKTWSTLKPIYYTSSTNLFLAAKVGSATAPNGGYFNGGLSDVRIYCTALSAADIKQLYEMGAKVDNKGNLHTYEFNENGSNKLKKTGIFYNYAVEPYKQLPDGSCWKLMLFHYVDGGRNLFTSSNATYNNGFGLYSRLRDINNFKYNNKYEFYVLQDDKEFRWTQTSQPTASSISGLTTVSGYTNPVNGLAKASQSNTYIGYSAWWGACGCWTSYSTGGKTGIPGFGSHDGNGICTTYLALYTRIDTITYRNASNSHYANNLIEL